MLFAHRLVGLAHVDGVATVERGFERVERRAPELVAGEKIAERRERRGLRLLCRRMLVGGVGGGRASADELVATVRLGVVGLDRNVRVREPVGRVLRRGGDRGGGEFLRGAELAGDRRGRGGLAEVFRRLVLGQRPDRGRVRPQGLGQTHGVARHVLASERLSVRRKSGAGRRQQEKDDD